MDLSGGFIRWARRWIHTCGYYEGTILLVATGIIDELPMQPAREAHRHRT
jgi:hypothetical protein